MLINWRKMFIVWLPWLCVCRGLSASRMRRSRLLWFTFRRMFLRRSLLQIWAPQERVESLWTDGSRGNRRVCNSLNQLTADPLWAHLTRCVPQEENSDLSAPSAVSVCVCVCVCVCVWGGIVSICRGWRAQWPGNGVALSWLLSSPSNESRVCVCVCVCVCVTALLYVSLLHLSIPRSSCWTLQLNITNHISSHDSTSNIQNHTLPCCDLKGSSDACFPQVGSSQFFMVFMKSPYHTLVKMSQ